MLHHAQTDGTMQRKKFERILRDWHSIETRIDELKKHQIRATASEKDRENLVSTLQQGDALITMDWAMKLLPMFAREKTTDFFAKRGMSWHISHVLTKNNTGDYVQHTFVHILEGELQDTVAVTSILQHTLHELSKEKITKVYLRSDNAGCYKSSSTISSLQHVSAATNVKIASYFFSEAQAGKSACDRMSAVIKRKLHDHVDSGGDVKNTDDFFVAINSGFKSLAGLSVYVRKIENRKSSSTKLPGISTLNTFVFEDSGIRAYRHSTIGQGMLFLFDTMQPNSARGINRREGGVIPGDSKFWAAIGKPLRLERTRHLVAEHADEAEHCKPEDSDSCDSSLHLYRCPEEGCRAEFLRSSNLERHLLMGKHKLAPERLTLRDQSLKYYAAALEGVQAKRAYPEVVSAIESLEETTDNGKRAMKGWALRVRKRSERLPERSKEYIRKLFDEVWRTKVKVDPRTAEMRMKNSVDESGNLVFTPVELFNYRQIAAIFSRLAHKQKEDPPVQSDSPIASSAVADLFEQEGDEEEEFVTDPMFESAYDIAREETQTLNLSDDSEIPDTCNRGTDASGKEAKEELFK